MRRALALCVVLSVGGCQCFDDAYERFCADSGRCVDGGEAGGKGGGAAGGMGGGSAGGAAGGAAGGGAAGGSAGGAAGGSAGGAAGGTGGGTPSNPGALHVNVGPVDAGVCSMGTVELRNDAGLLIATQPMAVEVYGAGFGVYGPGCASPTAYVVLDAGTSFVPFWFLPQAFGTLSFAADGGPGFPVEPPTTILSTATLAFVFDSISAPSDGGCAATDAVTVRALGVGGVLVQPVAPLDVNFSSGGNVLFGSSPGMCNMAELLVPFPLDGGAARALVTSTASRSVTGTVTATPNPDTGLVGQPTTTVFSGCANAGVTCGGGRPLVCCNGPCSSGSCP